MFTVNPRALRHASRDLIRHGLDVDDRLQVPLPDTGRSGCATQEGLERVLAETTAVADGLRHLGDALDVFVTTSSGVDGGVGGALDRLLPGATS
ncbi:hypothetical protein [Nocardioides psychrotolerans]|uniref:hypothetical protein n=1 Tax=Nocardioides psychrotolerans TaxID=1005945 RepID=UPI0031378DE3